MRPARRLPHLTVAVVAVLVLGAGPPAPSAAPVRSNRPLAEAAPAPASNAGPAAPGWASPELVKSAQTVALLGLMSLAPMALLMVTAYVRISVVLILLRQALGSPQVPGNQVLTALALLLTALVMRPQAEEAYARGVAPLLAGRAAPAEAWRAGTAPFKAFMVDQIARTGHRRYLWDLYDHAVPPGPDRVEPRSSEEMPLGVVAPAFLLSELTTALVLGFAIYLPFLVIDLVVSAVLAAMGLVMLPPSLVALPLKLIVFVLADGWMLVAGQLLRSFGPPGASAGAG